MIYTDSIILFFVTCYIYKNNKSHCVWEALDATALYANDDAQARLNVMWRCGIGDLTAVKISDCQAIACGWSKLP